MKSFLSLLTIAALILMAIVMIAGCGKFSAPTATQPSADEGMGLWNPRPGDHVVPGVDIPRLRPGYYESQWGMSINPLNMPGTSLNIGADGGMLQLGRDALQIPAGALDNTIAIKMTLASVTGVAVDCGPTGLTFKVPATLVLSYTGTQYENMDSPSLSIFYAAPDGSFQKLPSTVDTVNKTVSAQLNHFSRYILS